MHITQVPEIKEQNLVLLVYNLFIAKLKKKKIKHPLSFSKEHKRALTNVYANLVHDHLDRL